MAEINDGDILRIGATWTYEGSYEVTNVWHARVVSGGGVTYAVGSLDVQEYMEDINVLLTPQFSDNMATDFITLSNPTQLTTLGAIAWATPLTGALGSEATASGVCLLGWARTLKPRVQIRKYFGIFTEAGLQDGEWNSTTRAAANAAMVMHVDEWSVGANLVLQGVAYNRDLGTFQLPISVTTALEPTYQRRRRRGRGS